MRCDRTTERNNFDFPPMSDQDRISPYNFKKKKKSNRQVMKIK